jgi:hypothetical protein
LVSSSTAVWICSVVRSIELLSCSISLFSIKIF